MMKVLNANLQKKKPPSRIKYESLNPLFSFRLPKDYHQKLKEYARRRGGSISGYFKQLIEKRERLIAMAIVTLRGFYSLNPDDLDRLSKMCRVSLDLVKRVKSFNDIGFNYVIESPHANIKLNAARCISFLVLHEIAELDIKDIAPLLKEDTKIIELGISLARSELFQLFRSLLLQKVLRTSHSMLISDIMQSILWILIENNEIVKRRNVLELIERLRKAREKLRRLSEDQEGESAISISKKYFN